MEDKFEEWLDRETKHLEKQTKRWYCHGWGCVFELLANTALEIKLAQLEKVKEKYIEIRKGEEGI